MPVNIRKLPSGKFRVKHGDKISAKGTTKGKAIKQSRLLNAVAHGWKLTGNRSI